MPKTMVLLILGFLPLLLVGPSVQQAFSLSMMDQGLKQISNPTDAVTTGLNAFSPEGFELKETQFLTCRSGYTGVTGGTYSKDFVRCKDQLKATVSSNVTMECMRLCQMQEYGYLVDNLGAISLNRTAIDKVMTTEFGLDDVGRQGLKAYLDDYETCFNQNAPNKTMPKYDDGCKDLQGFTTCFDATSGIANCQKRPAESTAPTV